MSTLPRRPLPRPSLLSMAIAGLLLAPLARGATITVNSTADDNGAGCTLREAITSINSGAVADGCTNSGPGFGTSDTILFDASVTGTITLNGMELQITKPVTIDGSDAGQLAVDGAATSRVLNVSNGPVTIEGLTIQNGSAGNGGGIFVGSSVSLTLTNSTVSGNSAMDVGGGVYALAASSVTLTNSTVSGNSAAYGGGFFLADSESALTLINSTVSGNSARDIGGGIFAVNSSSVTLTNSTLSGNSAGGGGGGIFAEFGISVTLTNSTVSGNSAGDGGGILTFKASSVTLTNSTVSGNSAGGRGGGIFSGDELTLTNSILADNVGGDCVSFSPVTGSYTLIKDDDENACGLINGADNNIIGDDPLLAALADNGCVNKAGNPSGPPEFYACVQTHALQATSPALDSADPTVCAEVGTVNSLDQRGAVRPLPIGGVCDRGAFELGPPAQPTAVTATAGRRQASVSWTPPTHTGLGPLVSCTATAEPGGATCTVPAGTNQCTIRGLTPGQIYRFTVTCTNGIEGFASRPSDPVTPSGGGEPVPALSLWGLLGGTGLMGLLGAWRVRRQARRREH